MSDRQESFQQSQSFTSLSSSSRTSNSHDRQPNNSHTKYDHKRTKNLSSGSTAASSGGGGGFFSGLLRRVVGRPVSLVGSSSTLKQGESSNSPYPSSLHESSNPSSPSLSEFSVDSESHSHNERPSVDVPNDEPGAPLQLMNRLKHIRSMGITKDYWMKDEKVKECYDCKAVFTTFRRKHHCRICGQIFCHKCASSIVSGDRFGYEGEMRVCNFCLRIMDEYPTDDFLSDTTLPSARFPHHSTNHARPASISNNTSNLYTPISINRIKSTAQPSHPDSPDSVRSSDGFRRMLSSSFFKRPEDTNYGLNTTLERAAKEESNHPSNSNITHPAFSVSITDDDEEDSSVFADGWLPSPFAPGLGNAKSEETKSLNNLDIDSFPTKLPVFRRRANNMSRRSFSRSLAQSRAGYYQSQLSISLMMDPVLETSLPDSREKGSDSQEISSPIFPLSPVTHELSLPYLHHLRRLLLQLLDASNIEQGQDWSRCLMPIMEKLCSTVNPDVRNGDQMDVRQYVKIKRIPGGHIHESCFVDGIVATKKPLHKRMLRTLENPRILLLTFALDYQRVENQFVSLEPVIAQEREHLKNLLGRILALEPSVILVQKTVSRLALEYLVEANVVVVQSVKPSLLEAISRFTRADILHSVDKLALSPQLGYCRQFFFKTWTDPCLPETRKTCMYIVGCPTNLGCTLILRGSDPATLSKLKPTVNLLALLSYSLRLETSLLRDQYCSTPQLIVIDPSHDKAEEMNTISKLHDKPFSVDQAIVAFEHTILSGSPSVKFPLPYLLGALRAQITKSAISTNNYFAPGSKSPETGDSNSAQDEDVGETLVDGDAQEGFAQTAPTGLIQDNNEDENAQASYLMSRILSLSPFSQQSILLLSSSYCKGQIVPCVPPQLELLEYYGESDLTLGQYVEETCLSAGFSCPKKGCEQPLGAHYRNYIHSHGKVTVSLDELPCPLPGMDDHIIMWSLCRVCKEATPFVPMSDETWKFSFGKYLELTFFHSKLSFRAISCPHDIHRDHIRYFSLHNMTIRIHFQPIDLYEVSVPSIRFQPSLDVTIKLRQQDLEVLRTLIAQFYDSCLERIKMFTYDIVAPSRINTCKDAMQDLSKRISLEKKFMLQRLQQTFIASAPTDYLALNEVYKHLQDQVTVWDGEFATFVRNHLSEPRDIRRVTAHIRRIFVEKDSSGTSVDARPQSLPTFPAPDPTAEDDQQEHIPTNEQKPELPLLGSSPPNSPRSLPIAVTNTEAPPLRRSMSMKKGRISAVPISLQRKLSVSLMRDMKISGKDGDITEIDIPSLQPSPSEAAMLFPNLVSLSPDIEGQQELDADLGEDAKKDLVVEPGEQSPVEETTSPEKPGWTMGDFDDDPEEEHAFDGEYEGMMYPRRLLIANTAISSSQVVTSPVTGDSTSTNLTLSTQGPSENVNRMFAKSNIVDDDEQKGSELNTITGVTAESEQRDEDHTASVIQNGERQSIMKTITNLWTGNPANFLPLEYPTSSSEHHFAESLIIVREDEPTSLISYTLGSNHYQEKLELLQSISDIEKDSSPTSQQAQYGIARFSKELDDPAGDVDDGSLKDLGPHVRYRNILVCVYYSMQCVQGDVSLLFVEFWDGTARMHCKVFFAEEFDALRKSCGVDSMFVQSLARCIKWDALGGRSGSAFLKTRDDWLVIKQLSRQEVDALYKFAPAYFEYMSQAVHRARPTVLAKLFGFYRIGCKSTATGKTFKMDLLVMENLFYKRHISNIFDLKGSTRNRHVQSTGKQNEVLMDENLLEFTYEKPLFIREHSKKLLRASVHNDTLFLSRLNVMDYSLLVGIDDETHELVVGIVDFVRTFTWDKKLESWVKESGILGGSGREPTIVTPRQYKNRFREAMERYFDFVPDRFSSLSR